MEPKPLDYYVEQAELWWQEVQKDKTSEDNWYNYFRACRNVHGTMSWSEDFKEKSPLLKDGAEIIALLEEYIPNTFMYYYLSYYVNGIGTGQWRKT